MKLTTDLFQIKVLVDGKPIQEYHKDANTFVEGRSGSNFELLLKNLTARRLLVHPSVDGISVMTGKTASKNDYSVGYILEPWQEMRVPGWRLNDEAVARFVFAGSGGSYAEKTGRGENKGVIAAAVWEEKVRYGTWHWYELPSKVLGNPRSVTRGVSSDDDFISHHYTFTDAGHLGDVNTAYEATTEIHLDSSVQNSGRVNCSGDLTRGRNRGARYRKGPSKSVNNLGTGFGKKAEHRVAKATFEINQAAPDAVAVIYYDDLRGLKNRGIRISRKKQGSGLPDPFPKDMGCEPPQGWRP